MLGALYLGSYMTQDINELIDLVANPPATFQEYLDRYAEKIGDVVNQFIPRCLMHISFTN